MRNGARRNKVEIQQQVQTGTDELKQPVYTWQAYASPWAEIIVRTGQEHFDPETKQRYSEAKYRFRCAYLDTVGVTTKMRIVYEGRNYDIRAVLPDEARKVDTVIEATLQDS